MFSLSNHFGWQKHQWCHYVGWPASWKLSAINFNRSKKVPRKLKREVFGYSWTNQWNFHPFNIWIFSNNLFVVKAASEVLISALQQINALSESLQVRSICTVNCITETEGIQWEKAALNPLVSRRSLSFKFSFCEGKTRFTHSTASNKRANSHNFKVKNLNLLTITFLAVYLMNRGKSSYMN